MMSLMFPKTAGVLSISAVNVPRVVLVAQQQFVLMAQQQLRFSSRSGALHQHLLQEQRRALVSVSSPALGQPALRKKTIVYTGKPWEEKCGIARLVRVGDDFNISITAFNAPTAAEQVRGILDQMDAAIKKAGGRGAADITISHIISNDVPKHAGEIAAAHKAYMESVGNVPASTIAGGSFGTEWMLVEMWASGTIQAEGAEIVEIRA